LATVVEEYLFVRVTFAMVRIVATLIFKGRSID
jgi:hypothetical protein